MAKELEVLGIGAFREDRYGQLLSDPHSIGALGGRQCRFAFDGFEGDPHPEDYVQAAQNFLTADGNLLAEATSYVHQYCVDMQKLWGDKAPTLDIREPADVWRY